MPAACVRVRPGSGRHGDLSRNDRRDGLGRHSEWADRCDDSDPAVHPGATEVCEDGVDNDCFGTDRSCSPSGEFQVDDGPSWTTNPQVPNFSAFVDGWADPQFCTTPTDEDFSKTTAADGGYDCGSFGCSYSAYVLDHSCAVTNYCWDH